jgi:hypothetical protein
VKGGPAGHDQIGQPEGATVTEESGLDRRDALKTLLTLGAAAPLAWTGTLPAQAAGLTSQQLAGQRAGLTLDEIRDLLAASDGEQAAIERLREVALRKLPEVRELIERTEIVRDWLEAATRCECPTLDECPLFDDPALLPLKAPGV